ncbi:MAG: hypothetical protein HY907_01105 [Deltaproteobacteria bacterium]|nr:hypothetical protein [Deltaproteobacteria bacterium]
MTREQLEHIIRASAVIADDEEIIIVGSQAVLGQFPAAPPELLVSTEADVYPRNHPDRADLIDGSIGEGSPFHDTFGYYAQGVGPETATLPEGWADRLVRIQNRNTRNAIGWCPEIHDLVLSKCAAGREKDWRFLDGAVRAGLVEQAVLLERLATMGVVDAIRESVRQHVAAAFRRVRAAGP